MSDLNDRKLLERVAKVARLDVIGPAETTGGQFCGLRIYSDGSASGYIWNPLEHDGDAIRLLMDVGQRKGLTLVVSVGGINIDIHHPSIQLDRYRSETDHFDFMRAFRRMVVEAVDQTKGST